MRAKNWKTKSGRMQRKISAFERQIAFNEIMIDVYYSGLRPNSAVDTEQRKAKNEQMRDTLC